MSAIKALGLACLFTLAFPLAIPDQAQAQSWRQQDPSAIVLPGQSSNSSRRDSGGGLFRIFQFEPQRQTRRRQPTPQVDVAPQVVLPPPKDPDARTVVVLGDEFADQMNEGLIDRFDGDRLMDSVGVSIPGTGLTRPDLHDWNIEGLRRLDGFDQIAAVVVTLGFSDGQELFDDTARIPFGTQDWQRAYRNRLTNLALTLLTEGHQVIFVGLPPYADRALDEQARFINQAMEQAIAPTRARFVDVYEAFSDVQGNYVRAGPDLAGQVVNLRRSDGVFFNRAGRAKYAQLVERFIPRAGQETIEQEVSTVIFEGSSLADDGIGPVILLTSGFTDPSATLAEDVAAVRPAHILTRERLLRGAQIEPPEGRADSFARPPPPEPVELVVPETQEAANPG
jgi:hypothetical protein